MELTITRRDSTTYSINVATGELKQELMNADTVTLNVISATPIEFRIDDQATILGRRYRINRLPQAVKTASNSYSYTVEMEGEMYNLIRSQYLLFDSTGIAIEGEFSYMANLEDVARLLIKNLNRTYGAGKYVLGTFPATEARNHTFSSENCLAVIQRVCADYEQEFDLIYNAGVTTLNIGAVGSVKSFSLMYGAGAGLYELERQAINDKNVFTRLFAYGSERNLKGDYRNFSKRLKLPLNEQSVIEDAAAIAAMGVIEHTKVFDDVYPHRTGIVSTVADAVTFTDSGMDFDLNATSEGSTLYLIAGNPAKVHFNTGNLAGYEFEILSYTHATKTFVLKKYKDERGLEFPSTGAFAIQAGDEYVLLDITMPQSYVDAAEAELQAKATAYLNQGKVVKAKYTCKIDPIYAKTENLSLQVGDYVPIEDAGLNINRSFRVISLTRDIIEPYRWTVDLGDEVEVNYITQLFQDRIETNKLVQLNKLKDPAVYRNAWKTTKELQSMIFDQEDYFDTSNIKPLSIETSMLSVGSKAGQFVLNGVVFQPSFNAVANRIASTAGTLSHYAIEENIRTWNISAYDVTLADNNARYIYAKCDIATNLGEIRYSTSQLKVDAEAGYYNLLIGVLHSVLDGYRRISLTYGSTTINGKEVKTGRITSQDGQTYFDLDTGQIAGKITFNAGSSGYNNLSDKPDLSVYSEKTYVDTITANLQAQVDGQIMTYFSDYEPTLANAPANGWTTTADKDKHLGDLFYNSVTGIGYRFSLISGVYSWQVLKDTEVATALANSAAAQTTANSKRRVFVATPTTPYEVGDLWTQGTAGDLMKCKTTRLSGSYSADDWEKASKYTDDTTVNSLQIGNRQLLVGSAAITIDSGSVSSSLRRISPSLLPGGKYILSGDLKGGYIRAYASSAEPYENGVSLPVNTVFSPSKTLSVLCYYKSGGAVRADSVMLNEGDKPLKWQLHKDDYDSRNLVIGGKEVLIPASGISSPIYFSSPLDVDVAYIISCNNLPNDGYIRFYPDNPTWENGVTMPLNTLIVPTKPFTHFRLYGSAATVTDIILTKGDIPISYSPAPEDIQAQLDNITLDSKFSPSEKQSIRVEWERIFNEKAALVTTGTALGITIEVADINTYFQALATYLNGGTTWSTGTPLWISDAQLNTVTDIDAATFRSNFQFYYNAAIALRREIDAVTDDNITSVENNVASLNYLKQALTGSTEVQGGLVGTNVLLLKTLAGIITGGFSGLSSDNVGFWTGGDYQNAIDSLAKVLFRKDGSGQLAGGKILWDLLGNLTVGDLAIDNSGAVTIKDGASVKVVLTKSDITSLEAIAGSTQNSTTNNVSKHFADIGVSMHDFPNQIVVNNNNSLVTVSTQMFLEIDAELPDTSSGSSSVTLQLRNVSTGVVIPVTSRSLSCYGSSEAAYPSINVSVMAAAGTYSLRMIVDNQNYIACTFYSGIGSSTVAVTYDGSFQRLEIGKNGFGVIGNANNYLFAGIENGVFKVVEKTTGGSDRPGVLAAGSVSTIGGTDKSWGAKVGSSSKLATGSYRVNHSVGHADYFVQITPRANARIAYISATFSTYFTVVLTNTSGKNTDTAFDYQIVGNNQ